MRLADLVFLVAFLSLLVGLARIGIFALRGRPDRVRRLAIRLVTAVGVYLAIVVAVSLATPRRWVAVGEAQCFDDWCITIVRADRVEGGYRITARVASRARGRPQRESDVRLVLVAGDGRVFEADPAPAERSLRSMLQPGESFETRQDFAVPADAEILGADVVHGPGPGWFVIGDRASLLHRRTLVRMEGDEGR